MDYVRAVAEGNTSNQKPLLYAAAQGKYHDGQVSLDLGFETSETIGRKLPYHGQSGRVINRLSTIWLSVDGKFCRGADDREGICMHAYIYHTYLHTIYIGTYVRTYIHT